MFKPTFIDSLLYNQIEYCQSILQKNCKHFQGAVIIFVNEYIFVVVVVIAVNEQIVQHFQCVIFFYYDKVFELNGGKNCSMNANNIALFRINQTKADFILSHCCRIFFCFIQTNGKQKKIKNIFPTRELLSSFSVIMVAIPFFPPRLFVRG